jgi:hypothetical protein
MAICDDAYSQGSNQNGPLSVVDNNTQNERAKNDKNLFSFRSKMIKEKNTLKSTQSKYASELEDYLVYIQQNFDPDRNIDILTLWHSHKLSFKVPLLAL